MKAARSYAHSLARGPGWTYGTRSSRAKVGEDLIEGTRYMSSSSAGPGTTHKAGSYVKGNYLHRVHTSYTASCRTHGVHFMSASSAG
jgi:hypothetical protein